MSDMGNSKALIELRGIEKSFGDRQVLEDISFSLYPGRVHAFLGPNGAGKTTTMKIIAGLSSKDRGEVIGPEGLTMGVLLERAPMYLNMRVEDFLRFVLAIHGIENEDNLEETVELCQLKEVRSRLIRNLSFGYRTRVSLAQAIVHKPDLIILDEPTVGLDHYSVEHMNEVIKELKKNHTILLSTHQLHEANKWCDDLTVMNHGKVLATGNISDIRHKIRPLRVFAFEIEGECEKEVQSALSDFVENISSLHFKNGRTHLELSGKEDGRSLSSVGRELMDQGFEVSAMIEKKMNIEEIFKNLTASGEQHELQ